MGVVDVRAAEKGVRAGVEEKGVRAVGEASAGDGGRSPRKVSGPSGCHKIPCQAFFFSLHCQDILTPSAVKKFLCIYGQLE